MTNDETTPADIQTLITSLEQSKPRPYCIALVDAFETIEELHDRPLEDEIAIFHEHDRPFVVELFKGWPDGILAKLITYIRTLEKEHREMRNAIERGIDGHDRMTILEIVPIR